MDGNTASKPFFIDLFAGCGGLSIGLMQAGWQGLFAVEKDRFAFQTLKQNLLDERPREAHAPRYRFQWPDWLPREPIAIGNFVGKYEAELKKLRGQVTLIAGGPPCQGFSTAGRRKRNDPRNQLFKQYIETVRLVRPPLLLLENVRGIASKFRDKKKKKKKGNKVATAKPKRRTLTFSERIQKELERLGYHVQSQMLTASDYGVPQARPRFLIVAVDKKSHKRLPDGFKPFEELAKMRKQFLKKRRLPLKPVTAEQALSDLEVRNGRLIECVDSTGFKQIVYGKPRTLYQKLMHGAMNGTAPNSLRLANHRPEIVARFSTILRDCTRGVPLNQKDRERFGTKKHSVVPMDPTRPSRTLTTLPDDFIHYSEPRILSVREYARLQSFPDWFEFKGKYTTGGKNRVKECPRYTQVGNAVPPLMAECIGQLLQHVNKRAKRGIRLRK